MSTIAIILVVIIAFFAGLEGILDQFQIHQPLVSATLIGLVTGHLTAGIILGGTLQMIALGWANIGAAVAPDVALASVASSIIMVKGGDFSGTGISVAVATAIPLAVAGLFLTMVVRTIAVGLTHGADAAAKEGKFRTIETLHLFGLLLQGLRIAIPAAILIAVPAAAVKSALTSMPEWLTGGMAIGGGMVVAVGYALVINMMATREVWPFFAIGFALAAVSQLTLIALGAIGVAIALIYINLSKMGGNGGGSNGGGSNGGNDPVGDILNEY
ncbi:PTS mannose/fructose/sorbose transporter subunit IIC [Leuconostoc falkenbergense]|uniref:PTS mannose/fructose/sorbose transporter subunit IIC n=1 Tax=Leuconostoc falkenbergense TaxID=2766470 RepID=A0ABT7S043_9LACO|nr:MULTISPECIES: PTS mannose/fructose/sorbose transporter subunit IIC [Leuconostoc]VTU57802.1 PTS mannose transporter subunit IIC [Lactobacillus ginsenosidimutans] [Leuconostoc pseudomesenteroides]MCT4377941.1 PTS mannose/fructose/sorbose transporter subunit IIC [Leuconostoc falkenbergense]MCT4411800.1 PTS mannose/fructose/sorbose transporter subunit IIC [Leuconostoc falkenbergense]MDI6553844.1 PTS mannose/fructose/sorbose transporter subunit IIC [Leuconostoc falkenbergense]MDM7646916.1 PTS ma